MTSFTITRTLDAPRDLVWRAWTDPALTARWWHPDGVDVKPGTVAIDLREGGTYAYTMVADGGEWPTGGTYLEIREPELLRFTWREIGEEDDTAPLATVTLRELGADDAGGDPDGAGARPRTEMTFTLERLQDKPEMVEDVQDGWRSAFDDVLVPLLAELG